MATAPGLLLLVVATFLPVPFLNEGRYAHTIHNIYPQLWNKRQDPAGLSMSLAISAPISIYKWCEHTNT
nr:hypothetical protein Q903MT_gene2320 [Picea sitchensis]